MSPSTFLSSTSHKQPRTSRSFLMHNKLCKKKKKKKLGGGSYKIHTDTRFIILKSNLCKQIFSKAKILLDDKRGRLLPFTLEEQMSLLSNHSLCDITDIQSIVTKNNLPVHYQFSGYFVVVPTCWHPSREVWS